MIVGDLELRPVASVCGRTTLVRVAQLLAASGDGVVVIDGEPLSEIVERDVVTALAAGVAPTAPVARIPRDAPQFVRPDTSAEDAAAIMLVTRRHALVVVDEGHIVGLVPLRTAVGALYGMNSWVGAFRMALHVERQ
jgi:CBS domain-containing protein